MTAKAQCTELACPKAGGEGGEGILGGRGVAQNRTLSRGSCHVHSFQRPFFSRKPPKTQGRLVFEKNDG